MSKALYVTAYGGVEVMKVYEEPIPKAEADQVVVNIKASGLNFSELMARQGLYDRVPNKPPVVLGYEGAGIVHEVGQNVTKHKVGDRVMVICNKMGMWREYAAIDADSAFIIPDNMTFEEAAAIPVTYITAYLMLFDMANLRKGKSVLVHMAAGGVGFAATQLCHTVPDVTVFGTASAHKHDIIRAAGVTHPIDYRTKDYVEEIRKISPSGVDIVLDPLAGEDSVKGFNLLKPMGKIVHFGAANLTTGTKANYWSIAKTWWATKNINPLSLMPQNKGVFGFHAGYLMGDENKVMLEGVILDLLELYKQGKIKPKIDSVWSYEQAGDAMQHMHDRKNIGKIILSPEKENEKLPLSSL